MRMIIVLPIFAWTFPVWAAPIPVCAHSASTAKVLLADLYTAEKAYFAEYASYSQNLDEIGVWDKPDDCDTRHWKLQAYTRRNDQGFVGVATSLVTGETWEINDRKHLRQVPPAR